MFSVLITLLFVAIPLVTLVTVPNHGVVGLATFVALIAIANAVSGNVREYNSQINDLESISENEGLKDICRREADLLTKEFKLYLGTKYPTHERKIFELISQGQADNLIGVLTHLPEIKASETLIRLVTALSELNSRVFSKERKIEGLKKDMRVRMRNPYYVTCFHPMYEETPTGGDARDGLSSETERV